MGANESTHDRSSVGQWNTPFLYFGSGEGIIGRVYGVTLEEEGEWRGTPPLNRLLTGNRWDVNEIEMIILKASGRDETPAVNRGGLSSKK